MESQSFSQVAYICLLTRTAVTSIAVAGAHKHTLPWERKEASVEHGRRWYVYVEQAGPSSKSS